MLNESRQNEGPGIVETLRRHQHEVGNSGLGLGPYPIRDCRDGLPFGEVVEEGEGDDGDQEDASDRRDGQAWSHGCKGDDVGMLERATRMVSTMNRKTLRRQCGWMQVRGKEEAQWFVLQKAAAPAAPGSARLDPQQIIGAGEEEGARERA